MSTRAPWTDVHIQGGLISLRIAGLTAMSTTLFSASVTTLWGRALREPAVSLYTTVIAPFARW